jgi:hypothetical protein
MLLNTLLRTETRPDLGDPNPQFRSPIISIKYNAISDRLATTGVRQLLNRGHGPTCTIEDYPLASVFQPPQNDIEFPTYFSLRHLRYRPSLKGGSLHSTQSTTLRVARYPRMLPRPRQPPGLISLRVRVCDTSN